MKITNYKIINLKLRSFHLVPKENEDGGDINEIKRAKKSCYKKINEIESEEQQKESNIISIIKPIFFVMYKGLGDDVPTKMLRVDTKR